MVKTHLRDMIIVPEMIGSVCGVYVCLPWFRFGEE
jgi:ribosomal protein S19